MANDFKRFAQASVNTSTGASATAVYTTPAGAGSTALESIVIGLMLSNKTSSDTTVNVFLDNYDGTNDVYLLRSVNLPANTTLEVLQGNKIVLQNSGSAGDIIRVSAADATTVDATVSVLEDV